MKYLIEIEQVKIEKVDGFPHIVWRRPLPHLDFITECQTTAQLELLYNLTDKRTNLLHKALEKMPDSYYRIKAREQSGGAKLHNNESIELYKWIGHCLIEKIKDQIFIDQKYFQIGQLNELNLKRRDVQEEVRRGHIKHSPGVHETSEGKKWKELEPMSDKNKKFSYDGGVA